MSEKCSYQQSSYLQLYSCFKNGLHSEKETSSDNGRLEVNRVEWEK